MNTRHWIFNGALGLTLLGVASIMALSGAGMGDSAMSGHGAMATHHFGGGLIYQLGEARRFFDR